MSPSSGDTVPSKDVKVSSLKTIILKLRKRHIIETLAAFIGGGWLVYEVVERVFVMHFKFPEGLLDITLVTLVAAMLCTILWRWFMGSEKRPGNVKVEVLLVPLIILIALAIDLNLILQMAGMPGKKLLIGIVAFLLGITWVFIKLYQWAAMTPELGRKEVETSSPAPSKQEKSIVVLPFADLSPQKDQEYFCDGMTEEIITDLSCCQDLLVISRFSAMTLKGSPKTLREIAKELNVRYALEGSVRKAGNDLRITAQLIDADTDVHLWADKYSGTLNDVFDIQEKVSRAIVDALRLKLTHEEKRRIAERPIDDIVAYECYLKARTEIWNCTDDSLNQAIRYFQHGLEIIGDNALLYSGMAYAYWQYVNIGLKQEEGIQKAEEYVKRALAIDPNCSKAHAVIGWINQLGGNTRKSVDHFRRALAVNPDDPFTLQGLAGTYIAIVGKIPAAIPLCVRLMQIDPLDFVTNFMQLLLRLYDGDYSGGIQVARRLHENYPENLYGEFVYAVIMAYNNEIDKSLAVIDKNTKADPDTILAKLGLMLKYEILKEKEKAFQLITPDFRKTCLRDPTYCHLLAGIFSLLDEKEEALDWLEHAVNAGFINYPLLAEKDPWLTSIRGELRFKKLMERVKYEWEHFEV